MAANLRINEESGRVRLTINAGGRYVSNGRLVHSQYLGEAIGTAELPNTLLDQLVTLGFSACIERIGFDEGQIHKIKFDSGFG